MMNDDMLRNIEYLREKADVSYEEAANLLERYDGNVMRVLVELERQGRVYPQGQAAWEQPPHYTHSAHQEQKARDAKAKASNFINDAFRHRVVVESGSGENKRTIANLSAPYAAVASVLAPYVAIPSIGLMFMLGYRVKIKKDKDGGNVVPENMESFVDQTVSNVKKTANSFVETVKSYDKKPENNHRDDDDEGGEITIE